MKIYLIAKALCNLLKDLPKTYYIRSKTREQRLAIVNRGETKRIYLFCAPTHSNLGDQAQLLCWQRLFAKWYPRHELIQVSTIFRRFETLREIRKTLKAEDKLFVHSGYLFFDPHPELPFILDIVRMFYDHPITILPQTVNFTEPWMRQVVARELDMHSDLTLLCRDEVSFEKARQMFHNAHLRLMPDVVTSLIGDSEYQANGNDRRGVMFCLRNDVERHYKEEEIQMLINRFGNIRIGRRDTTIKANMQSWEKHRKELIRGIIGELSSYEVVITDRYHGTILSAIADTPVIVINSADHKLSSGVKWFNPEIFGKAVQFAPTLEDAYCMAKEILDCHAKITNPPYFMETFWKNRLEITPPHGS